MQTNPTTTLSGPGYSTDSQGNTVFTGGTAVSGSPSQIDRASSTGTGGSMGQDAFLKLLVAQMQHQDPLQPTDSAAMMSQLAQFSSVQGINNLQAQMKALNVQQDFTSSMAMMGKNVTYLTTDVNGATITKSGTVTAVQPDPNGSILTIGGDQVRSGDVKEVSS